MDWEVLIWNGQFATNKRLKHYEGIKRTQKEKIDSLNSKVAVMKKNLNQKANSGIDKIIEKQEKWHKRGWRKDCRTSIKNNASFDNAVKHIVSTVLKA